MRERGGFILVAALWLIVALSAVGLDAALRTQASRAPALNQLDFARAREAALAGAAYAESRLNAALDEHEAELRAEAGADARLADQLFGRQRGGRRGGTSGGAAWADPWRDPHELMAATLTLGDSEFTLDVHDTGVALHLNTASEDMLRAFLSQGLRIDYATADRLTQAILDWRDEDDLPRINGGEAEQYIRAGAAVLPANRQFADPDELRYVLGMTADLFERIRPHVTVTGSGRINVNAAPESVLLALPGFTPAAVAELMRLRNAELYPRTAEELRGLLGRAFGPGEGGERELASVASYRTLEVEVVSHGQVTGGRMAVTARTVISLSRDGAVVTWRKLE